jgi:hypothetical protein
MRLSDVNFRREAWWLLLLAAIIPIAAVAADYLWPR